MLETLKFVKLEFSRGYIEMEVSKTVSKIDRLMITTTPV
jgi:hypothetical protein